MIFLAPVCNICLTNLHFGEREIILFAAFQCLQTPDGIDAKAKILHQNAAR